VADIFLSYASQDRARAKVLAEALAQLGWSVWWDRTIPSGKRFDQVIAEALAGARSILVLWSTKSVTSDWVIEEAEEGRRREILIPVFIEGTPPPMGFRRIQGADLVDWDGTVTSPPFRTLAADIEAVLGAPMKTKAGAGEIGETKDRGEARVVEQERMPILPHVPPKRGDVPRSNVSPWSAPKTILATAVFLALTVSVGYGVKLWYDQEQETLPQEQAPEEARGKEQERLAQERAAEEARRKEQARLAQQRAAEEARPKEQETLAQERAVEEARRTEQERLAQEQAAQEARRKEQERLAQKRAAEEARRKEQARLAQQRAAEEARRKEQERLAQQRAAEEARRKEQERLAQQRVVRRSAFRPPEAGRLYYYDIDAATQVNGSDNEVDFWFKADNPQDPNSKIGVLPVNGAKYAPHSAGLFPWELDESSFTSSQGVYPVPQRQDIPCFTSKKQPCTFRLQSDPGGDLLVSFVLYK
jgi:hypothetical protein